MEEKIYDYFSNIKGREVEWLWYPYIPYGKLTVIQGDPGEGKSTFMINVASILTNGGRFPDGKESGGKSTVIYQCSEDDLADTVKPRLEAAGADCSRVAFIDDEQGGLNLGDDRIEITIKETGARLMILDPIQSFMCQDGDMQSASRMRSTMGRLARIASKYRCAVVLVGHMNKGSGNKNLYRSLGSIDIVAIARSVLMVERDAAEPEVRHVYPIKSSLAPEGPSINFRFDDTRGFMWAGTGEKVCDIAETVPVLKKVELAQECLMDMLSEKAVPCSEIMEVMESLGISKRTVLTAKKELGIISEKTGMAWCWRMPEDDDSEEYDGQT